MLRFNRRTRELVRDWLQPRDKLDEWDRDDATIRCRPRRFLSSTPRLVDATRLRRVRLRPDPGKQFRSHHFVAHLAQPPLPTTMIYNDILPSHLSRAHSVSRVYKFSPSCRTAIVLSCPNLLLLLLLKGRRTMTTTTTTTMMTTRLVDETLAVPPDGTRVLLRVPLRTFFHP